MSSPIPVTVITGFLGAGKTTLLNHILHGDHGLRAAVLVNDFGSINIDAKLITSVEGETVSLANGCICCTIRHDLLTTAHDLAQRNPPPEYLLIEASGVSDPVPIATTFDDPNLHPFFQVDGILALVDAETALDHFTAFNELFEDQLSWADLIVLNKTDLVTAGHLAEVRDWLTDLVPQARVFETSHARIPFELALGIGRYDSQRLAARHPNQHHTTDFATTTYTSDRPLHFQCLFQTLSTLPAAVFRAKGLAYTVEIPDEPVLIQITGRRVRVFPAETAWDGPGRTELVFIGRPGALDPAEINHRLDGCRQPDPHAVNLVDIAANEWIRNYGARTD